jgi:hypothetical protein
MLETQTESGQGVNVVFSVEVRAQAFAHAPRFRSGLGETAPAVAAPTLVGVETQTRPGWGY